MPITKLDINRRRPGIVRLIKGLGLIRLAVLLLVTAHVRLRLKVMAISCDCHAERGIRGSTGHRLPTMVLGRITHSNRSKAAGDLLQRFVTCAAVSMDLWRGVAQGLVLAPLRTKQGRPRGLDELNAPNKIGRTLFTRQLPQAPHILT